MKENTRQKLIDATYEEVYSKGYQGASLKDILQNAKVHKGSMYHYFANKKEMALAAIDEKISQRFDTRYGRILELDSNYIDEFFKGVKDLSNRDFNRGCPVANIIQEMSNIDDDFRITMNSIYKKFKDNLEKILDKSIQKKEIKQCDKKKIALYITSTLEGAILSAKASGEAQDYIDTIELLEEHINTLKI